MGPIDVQNFSKIRSSEIEKIDFMSEPTFL